MIDLEETFKERPLLEIKDLNLLSAIHTKPLWQKNLTVDLYKGQLMVVLGPSGCGKTTLLDALLNLRPPGYLNGQVALNTSYAYLTIKNYLLNGQSIKNNLESYYNVYNYQADRIGLWRYLREVQKVDLSQPVSSLSFGTRRRIALYRTLHINANYYFLDEPTTGFDMLKIREANDFILYLKKIKNKSFFIITHESRTAAIADKILLLSNVPHLVKKDEQSTYVKVFRDRSHRLEKNFKIFDIEYEKVFEYKTSASVVYKITGFKTQALEEAIKKTNAIIHLKTRTDDLGRLAVFFLSSK